MAETYTVSFKIPEIRLEREENISIGNLKPYKYQWDAISKLKEEDSFFMFVTAGTGMGKTAITVLSSVQEKQNAMILYPTNELIENQEKSIIKTIKTAMPDKNVEDIAELSKVNRLTVREVMDELKLVRKAYSLQQLLAAPLKQNIVKFTLTNPDTLYLVLTLKYGKKSDIRENFVRIIRNNTLVIDEFHNYKGRELFNMLYIIAFSTYSDFFPKILFLSATPNSKTIELLTKTLERMKNSIGKSRKIIQPIKPAMSTLRIGNPARWETEVFIFKSTDDNLKEAKDKIISLKDEIKQKRSDNPSHEYVPLIVILESVVDARTLSLELLDQGFNVTEIHGFVPPSQRRITNKTEIVVGTSAIELGIDFQATYLIFEAYTAENFIQRLGRIGRHAQGKAFAFMPEYVINYLRRSLNRKIFSSYEEFEKQIYDSFLEQDTLDWYVQTPWSAIESIATLKKIQDEFERREAIQGIFDDQENIMKILEAVTGCNLEDIEEAKNKYEVLRNNLNKLGTFRSSEPQLVIHDTQAEQKGLFPFYTSPVNRIAKRANFRIVLDKETMEPKNAVTYMKPFCGKTGLQEKDNVLETILRDAEDLGKRGNPQIVAKVSGYHKFPLQARLQCYDEDEASNVTIVENDLLEPIITYQGEEKFNHLSKAYIGQIIVLEKEKNLEAIRKLPWEITRIPTYNNQKFLGYTFFNTDVLIALAIRHDKKQKPKQT